MKPINEYIKNPNLETGGSLVTLSGPPGCGKTNSLTQLAIERLEEGHKVLWRGTAQAEWANFLANDKEVIIWKDENITSFEAWVSKRNGEEKDVEIREKVSEIKEFSSGEDLVSRVEKGAVNVVIVPGLMGDTEDKYYFRKNWINILQALIERRDVAVPYSFFTDEGGDIWPCQQQLRKPFYKLVVEDTPPLLAQLRKQMVFMYVAAHSTHDLHYFVWKIKGNTIAYMSNSNVKNDIHSSVDQSKVNQLDRGQVIVPPMDRAKFLLAYESTDLDWVKDDGVFNTSWNSDIPNLLENESEEDKMSEIDVKKEIADSLYNSDELDLSQTEVADMLGISQGAVSQAVA